MQKGDFMIFEEKLAKEIGEAMYKDMTFMLPIKMFSRNKRGLLDLSMEELSSSIVYMSRLRQELKESGMDMERLPEDLKNLNFIIQLADDVLGHKLKEDGEIQKAKEAAEKIAELSSMQDHEKRKELIEDIKKRLENLPTSKISELLLQINNHGALTDEEINDLLKTGMKEGELSSVWHGWESNYSAGTAHYAGQCLPITL